MKEERGGRKVERKRREGGGVAHRRQGQKCLYTMARDVPQGQRTRETLQMAQLPGTQVLVRNAGSQAPPNLHLNAMPRDSCVHSGVRNRAQVKLWVKT